MAGLNGNGTGGADGPIKRWRRFGRCSPRVRMVWRGGDADGNGSGGLSSEKDGGAAARVCRASGESQNADVVTSGTFVDDADDERRNVLTFWWGWEAIRLLIANKDKRGKHGGVLIEKGL